MGHKFDTTRWSLVFALRDDAQSREALSTLCMLYWFPLYAFVRRRGYSLEEAQDLTQEFFARVIERNDLSLADREKGRFRSFLLGCMKNFLADQWDKTRAKKRGGNQAKLSLDYERAEGLMSELAETQLTPEQLYDREWARTTVACALGRLEDEYRASNKKVIFDSIKPILTQSSESIPYKAVAEKLGMSEGAVRVTVHRMRKRFGEHLRAEIVETLTIPGDADTELKYLLSLL